MQQWAVKHDKPPGCSSANRTYGSVVDVCDLVWNDKKKKWLLVKWLKGKWFQTILMKIWKWRVYQSSQSMTADMGVWLMWQFLAKHSIPQVRQHPFRSCNAPCGIFSSLILKRPCKAKDLMTWKQLNTVQQSSSLQFQKFEFRGASSTDKTTRTNIYMLKESVLEGD
jgi:hypothetical protein